MNYSAGRATRRTTATARPFALLRAGSSDVDPAPAELTCRADQARTLTRAGGTGHPESASPDLNLAIGTVHQAPNQKPSPSTGCVAKNDWLFMVFYLTPRRVGIHIVYPFRIFCQVSRGKAALRPDRVLRPIGFHDPPGIRVR
jgi:hypothetical protein